MFDSTEHTSKMEGHQVLFALPREPLRAFAIQRGSFWPALGGTIVRGRSRDHVCRSLGTGMELAFRTKKLRTLCQEHGKAVNEIGELAAEALRTRIADLRAATYLADLPVDRPVVIDGNHPKLHLALPEGWKLSMAISHQMVPRTDGGNTDLTRVRRIRVEDLCQ